MLHSGFGGQCYRVQRPHSARLVGDNLARAINQ
jgi:hypothetical protein